MANSLVVWRGASRYDGAPLRAVVSFDSSNVKTGPMAQLWILRDDVAPHTAQRTGDDASVCGMCPLRPALSGGCYVVTFQGPLSVWKATASAPVAGAGEISGALRKVKRGASKAPTLRLGAYGDPAALPEWIVPWLVRIIGPRRVTGYTHGHLHPRIGFEGVAHLRPFVMASVESPAGAVAAHAHGWRTFRGRVPGSPLMTGEIECLSESRGIACQDCKLCCGANLGARNISIPVHGFTVKRALAVVV